MLEISWRRGLPHIRTKASSQVAKIPSIHLPVSVVKDGMVLSGALINLPTLSPEIAAEMVQTLHSLNRCEGTEGQPVLFAGIEHKEAEGVVSFQLNVNIPTSDFMDYLKDFELMDSAQISAFMKSLETAPSAPSKTPSSPGVTPT